jgi:sensor histidine kinase YesM
MPDERAGDGHPRLPVAWIALGAATVGAAVLVTQSLLHPEWRALEGGAWIAGRMALLAAVYPLLLMPVRRRFASHPPRLGWLTCLGVAVLATAWTVVMEVVACAFVAVPQGKLVPALARLFRGEMPLFLVLPAMLLHAAALLELGFATQAHAHGALLRAERMRARSREARLQQLRNQLHPHFLFNALHGVSALLGSDPRRAEALLARLQALYRNSLRSLSSPFVTLQQEIDWSREYLEIERARFSDRLELRISLPAALTAVSVPPLILQPLVENAVKHGIGRQPGPGWIAITAWAEGEEVLVQVANTAPRSRPIVFGFGLRLTTRRLTETYGREARLEVHAEGGEIAFLLRLPRVEVGTEGARGSGGAA